MKKIIIVDDDADLRDAIASVLKGNYDISEASGKGEAVKALATDTFDLVILDVMMETMSAGFELAREIKKSAASPKILMLTGIDKETDINFKAEAGDPDWLPVDDYITKPLEPKALLEKVRALLS